MLVTLHRRESIGAPFAGICAALRSIAGSGVELVVPLHPNPMVRHQLAEALGARDGIHLTDPFSIPSMVRMMQRADLILTDSGGVQEEAPTLGTLVLVAREVTERPEGVEAGCARLVGCCPERILGEVEAALAAPVPVAANPYGANPYGDGAAAGRIVAGLLGEPCAPFAAAPILNQGAPLRLVG
jgi:UDP-N-acetylglucosamine 2-epimerase (non-hydrolysing)